MRTSLNEVYHIINRGVDKRKIFLDEEDHFRFVHDLFEFNDEKPALNLGRQLIDVRRQSIGGKQEKQPRKLLVEIWAFCLMPNHYHLLLKERLDGGIPLFMKKLNGGYAKYFNIKYKRSGTLFEGRYKAVLIKSETHFIHIPYYIHANPLDLIEPDWRERVINNPREAVAFLKNYKWSSYLDYCGKNNFPSVTQRKTLLKFFDGEKKYEKSMRQCLKNLSIDSIKHLALD